MFSNGPSLHISPFHHLAILSCLHLTMVDMISNSTVDSDVLWQARETGDKQDTDVVRQDPSRTRRSISPGLACTG